MLAKNHVPRRSGDGVWGQFTDGVEVSKPAFCGESDGRSPPLQTFIILWIVGDFRYNREDVRQNTIIFIFRKMRQCRLIDRPKLDLFILMPTTFPWLEPKPTRSNGRGKLHQTPIVSAVSQ